MATRIFIMLTHVLAGIACLVLIVVFTVAVILEDLNAHVEE
jgi:hypothetical protein